MQETTQTLQEATAEFLYNTYADRHPVLVAVIRKMLSEGEPAEDIINFIQQKCSSKLTTDNLTIVIEYMQSMPEGGNNEKTSGN